MAPRKPASQRLRENPKREMKRLAKSVDPATLKAVAGGGHKAAEARFRRLLREIAGASPDADVVAELEELDDCIQQLPPADHLVIFGALESALAVALLSPPNVRVRNKFAASAKRKGSPFTTLFKKWRKQERTGKEVQRLLLDLATNGLDFELSGDGKAVKHIETGRKMSLGSVAKEYSASRRR
jgi:hypothetical protein